MFIFSPRTNFHNQTADTTTIMNDTRNTTIQRQHSPLATIEDDNKLTCDQHSTDVHQHIIKQIVNLPTSMEWNPSIVSMEGGLSDIDVVINPASDQRSTDIQEQFTIEEIIDSQVPMECDPSNVFYQYGSAPISSLLSTDIESIKPQCVQRSTEVHQQFIINDSAVNLQVLDQLYVSSGSELSTQESIEVIVDDNAEFVSDQPPIHIQVRKKPGPQPRNTSHECTQCGKMYRFESDLKRHIISHMNNFQFTCNICGKSIKHKRNVAKHMIKMHSGQIIIDRTI